MKRNLTLIAIYLACSIVIALYTLAMVYVLYGLDKVYLVINMFRN